MASEDEKQYINAVLEGVWESRVVETISKIRL